MGFRKSSLGSLDPVMVSPQTDGPDVSVTQKNSTKRKWVQQAIGVGISLVCLWLIFRQVKINDLRNALEHLRWQFVALGVASLMADYAIRIHRWAIMLRAGGAQVKSTACVAPFLGSITLNNVLPFRAGDFVRALVFPSSIGVRRVTATASLLLERLVDLLTLLLSLGIGVSLSAAVSLPEWLGKTVIMLSLSGGGLLFFLVAFSGFIGAVIRRLQQGAQARGRLRLVSMLAIASDLILSLGEMSRPTTLLALFGMSMMIWLGEAGLFWALLEGLASTQGCLPP